MKTLRLDPFEFESSSSVEFLEINISDKKYGSITPYQNLLEFAVAASGRNDLVELGPELQEQDIYVFWSIRLYLNRFAKINVPEPCPWKIHLLYEEGLDWDGVIETPDKYIRYHWESTA